MNVPRFLAPALLLAALPAQVQWQPSPLYTPIPSLYGYAICHHELAAKTVLFGGQPLGGSATNATWEWDGAAWTQATPPTSPPVLTVTGMVYDSVRGEIVMLDAALNIWEYDGTTWAQRTPASSPPVRTGYGLAFDRLRGRTVLFGGVDSAYQFRNDTWEWDGTQWFATTPPTSPQVRGAATMAFDPVNQCVLLYGGVESYPWPSTPVYYQDHWQWDGVTWSLRSAMTPMGVISGTCQAVTHLQRNRVMLFVTNGTPTAVEWEWDGATWTSTTMPQVPPRATVAPVYDPLRDRVVWFGGYDIPSLQAIPGMTGVWEWDQTAWLRIGTTQPPRPLPRFGHGFAYLPTTQTSVLFGGGNSTQYADTWEWDGAVWTQRQPPTSPPARYTTCMVAQPSRGEIVLFGGQGFGGGGLGDTWVWNGTTWTQRQPAFSPPARYGHGMACDTGRDRVVLFGGTVGFGTTNTTYEWDGVTWAQRTLPASPPARTEANLAYDAARGRTVLFGGLLLADTWEYDGTTWVARASGPPQGWPMLAYDAARERTVLFGNSGQAWEWDGVAWLMRTAVPAPPGRQNGGLAYDTARRRIVMFSGINSGTKDDTWEYGPVVPAAWATFGSGCPGSLGTPTVDAVNLPWLGSTCIVRVGSVPAGQFALLAIGSRVQWGGVPLPLALGSYGMPGCTLLAGGLDLRVLTPIGPSADAPVPLPNAVAMLGATFDVQGAVGDPAANAAGLVFTAGGTLTVGGR